MAQSTIPADKAPPTANQERDALINNWRMAFNEDSLGPSLMGFRARFMEHLLDRGKDIDEECGYPEVLTPDLLKLMHDREGIAKRVVNIFPEECWTENPEIYETSDEGTTTDFEQDWKSVEKKFKLYSLLQRADKTSGIGTFGIILLGIADGKQLIEPVAGVPLDGTMPSWLDKSQKLDKRKRDWQSSAKSPKHKLIYIRVFDESAVTINKFETDIRSPRYGQPLLYNVNFIQYGVNTQVVQPVAPMPTSPTPVHWTRIIHLADNRETSEVYGVPRMASVYNRLVDLRKLLGASAEMFWKGGFPGISFEVNPELQSVASLDPKLMREEFEQYQRGLQRYLALVGVSAKSLAVQVADPSAHFKTLVQAVGASLGIPYRVFIGSEEAKLAASQDSEAWMQRIANRQTKYVTPFVIEPLIYRLMVMGVVAPIADLNLGITVDWDDLHTPSDAEKAQVAYQMMQALQLYVTGGCDVILPPKMFFKLMMNMDEEEIETAMAEMKKYLKQAASSDGGGLFDVLHPPEPTDPTQAPPVGGMPQPDVGKGGTKDTQVGNFPNGGDPKKQQAAQRGGTKVPASPIQAPPMQGKSPEAASKKTPSIAQKKKPKPVGNLRDRTPYGYSTVGTMGKSAKRTADEFEMARNAGALAKRSGKGPSVPTPYCAPFGVRNAWKAGYRSVARKR